MKVKTNFVINIEIEGQSIELFSSNSTDIVLENDEETTLPILYHELDSRSGLCPQYTENPSTVLKSQFVYRVEKR